MGDFLQTAMTHSQLRNSDRQQLSRIALKQEEISAVLSIKVDVELLSIIKAAKESRYLSMFHAVILQIHKIRLCFSHTSTLRLVNQPHKKHVLSTTL